MNVCDNFIGCRSPKTVELFRQARLVGIAYRRFAICLDPFGMLDSEVVVNLLPELGVGVDFVSHGTLPGERFKCSAPPSTGFGAANASRARVRVFQKAACTRLRCALCRANWKTLCRWRCNNTASSPLCVSVWTDFVMAFFSVSNGSCNRQRRDCALV